MNTSFNTKKWVLPFLGFSLVEVLAAVAIIGIITFLAMPNIIAVKQDSENNLAISRAEALNIALVTFVQTNGHGNAVEYWGQRNRDQERYEMLKSYMAFAPNSLDQYMPLGYRLQFPNSIEVLSKVSLICLLYTSPSPRDATLSRMPSSA